MPGKASPVPFSNNKKNFGDFKAETFNMDDEADAKEYSRLRTLNMDAGSGIQIERVKELIKTDIDIHMEDGVRTETRRDHLNMYVEWWESKPKVEAGAADEAPRDFSVEWSPVVAEAKPGESGKN